MSRNAEKILRIEEFTGLDGEFNNLVAGYKVITNQQTITLEIDDERSCCEDWGYFWCNDNPQDFINARLLSISLTDTALNEAKLEKDGLNDAHFEGGIMFVNLETDKGLLQFVAYNAHNGYYGHEARVKSKRFMHSEVL